MFREFTSKMSFLSRVNPIVRAFIVSEGFFWSAWNFITPIFAVFVVEAIPGGNIQIAAMGLTVYLFVRVVTEMVVSNMITVSNDRARMHMDIYGMFTLSCCYLLVAAFPTLVTIYIFFIIAGISFGIASPAKFSLFSINLDKNKEAPTWGAYHMVTLTGMGVATSIGGFVANEFGFRVLFALASAVNFLGILPYVLYDREHKTHKHFKD